MKLNDMIIRKAQKEESRQIVELFMLAWPVEQIIESNGITYAELLESMISIAARHDTIYSYENTLVAEHDGEIIGALCAYNGEDYQRLKQPIADLFGPESVFARLNETGAGEFYLDSIGVLEKYRGMGVASKLITALIRHVRSLEHKVIGLIVDVDKPQVEALYSRLGFRHIDNKDFFGHTMKHMVLNLDES